MKDITWTACNAPPDSVSASFFSTSTFVIYLWLFCHLISKNAHFLLLLFFCCSWIHNPMSSIGPKIAWLSKRFSTPFAALFSTRNTRNWGMSINIVFFHRIHFIASISTWHVFCVPLSNCIILPVNNHLYELESRIDEEVNEIADEDSI